jgi:hypothetical protein
MTVAVVGEHCLLHRRSICSPSLSVARAVRVLSKFLLIHGRGEPKMEWSRLPDRTGIYGRRSIFRMVASPYFVMSLLVYYSFIISTILHIHCLLVAFHPRMPATLRVRCV